MFRQGVGLLVAGLSAVATADGAQVSRDATTLIVRVVHAETGTGLAGVALWASDRGFPEDIAHAVRTIYVPFVDGVAETTFDALDPGRYAVTVYRDANDNRRFDKNWIGIPREAWGVSNNVRPRLRAPRFQEAELDLTAGSHTIDIHLE